MTWSKSMQEGFVLARTIQRERGHERALAAIIPAAQQACQQIDEAIHALQSEEQEAEFRHIAEQLKPQINPAVVDSMEPRIRMWLARYGNRKQAAQWLKGVPEARAGFRMPPTLPQFLSELATESKIDNSMKEQRIAAGRKLFQERVSVRPQAIQPIVTEHTLHLTSATEQPGTFRDALAAEELRKSKTATVLLGSQDPPTDAGPTEVDSATLEPDALDDAELDADAAPEMNPEQQLEQRRNRMLVDTAMNLGDRAGFLQRLGAIWIGWENEATTVAGPLERAGRELRSLWEMGCLE